MGLRKIDGVEIFAVGTWNGEEYTSADLDEMVRAFEATSKTFRPPLKLGHTDNQTLLQQDGLPAAGWIGRLYRKGEKLVADLVDIPEKIFALIEKGAYKHVSSEIWWNADVGEHSFSRMLAGLALLGADMPAVTTLSDIIAMYGFQIDAKKIYADEKNKPTIKLYTFERETMPDKDDAQKNELEASLARVAELEEKLSVLENDAEKAQLKEFKAKAETETAELRKELAEIRRENHETKLNGAVNQLLAEKKISPAMKEYALQLLDENRKEYSFGEKKLSRLEVFAAALDLHAEMLKLNTKEQTVEGDEIVQGEDADEEIKKYAEENKVSYGAAYREVLKAKAVNKGDK